MKKMIFAILYLFFAITVFAENQVVNFNVDYKTVNFAGKSRKAIAVNDQIPGPILHFKEGDYVTINVSNHLDKDTAIHWHGLLVPWQMDGVEGISQKPIPPGGNFQYRFILKQAGTYWYHAHSGLQEQQGLYGGFIIDPPQSPPFKYTKDFVIVLSDWSNTDPDQILANLKKEGDYYSPRFPLQPSLAKFIHDYRKASTQERQNLIDDYKSMQEMRMSIYDFSDVAYDAFLLNGHTNAKPWTGLVKEGDIVRLRFIGAGGDTIFRVKIPNSTMTMVHVEGNDVKPYEIHDFTIAPGETYDVLVNIKNNEPYIIYAEARNTLGAAIGALITSPNQVVNYQQVSKFPEPLPVTREMMDNMMATDQSSSHHSMMSHANKNETTSMAHHMDMLIEPTIFGDTIHSPHKENKMSTEMHMHSMSSTAPSEEYLTFGTKYQNLKAFVKTNDPNKPIDGVINMELFGYMDRYVWFINGVPEYNAHPIPFKPGKRYRIIFTNNSMMHHPMHIHGHWFILRNGHQEYDPLLHTLDIPAGSTVTADIDADASGQWFFHCHLLYHMMTGMSRVYQYSTLIEVTKGEVKPENITKNTAYFNRPIVRVDEVRPIDISLVKHPMAHPPGFWFSTLLDMGDDPFHNAQRLTYKGMYGTDYHKLQLFVNDAEMSKGTVEDADIDIFYWHLLSQFWAVKGGANYTYRPAETPYWQPGIGIEGLIPYFIEADVRGYYHSGSAKLDIELSRDTQITNNFFIKLGVRSILASKTVEEAEVGSGLNQMRYVISPYYRLMPGLNIFVEYEHEQDYGVFRNLQNKENESTVQNTITFGITWLL